LAKKRDGLYENNYVLALEGRLVNFLYRTSLVENIFKSFFYVKSAFVTVNWKVITFSNQKCELFDIVSFLPLVLYDLILYYFYRLNSRLILHPPLRFFYISFIFFFCFIFRQPFKVDIPNRNVIDLYRLAGFTILY